MELTATQLPNLPIWSVSVCEFHCAVARIVQRGASFAVEPTRPGIVKFPGLVGSEMSGFRSVEAAITYVRDILA
jgi:hypothetical protein